MSVLSNSELMLSDTNYNRAKRLVQVQLPALGALYFGLANIWGLPSAENVVGTISVVCLFLGVTLGISNKNFTEKYEPFVGDIEVSNPDGNRLIYSLSLDEDPELIKDRAQVKFRVKDLDLQ